MRRKVGKTKLLLFVGREESRMSARREVIARVFELPEEKVTCANCKYMVRQFCCHIYCIFWGRYTQEKSICSFFDVKGESEND